MSIGNRSRFVAWVRRYGVSRLARDLGTNRRTVQVWNSNASRAPAASFMRIIIALSEKTPYDFGPLTYDDMLDGTVGLRSGQRKPVEVATCR